MGYGVPCGGALGQSWGPVWGPNGSKMVPKIIKTMLVRRPGRDLVDPPTVGAIRELPGAPRLHRGAVVVCMAGGGQGQPLPSSAHPFLTLPLLKQNFLKKNLKNL